MAHPRRKSLHLPQARTFRADGSREPSEPIPPERPGVCRCPCCGFKTFPVPPAEAVAYICPVCCWENDVFLASGDAPSDENHGLSLNQARENFRLYAVCDPNLAHLVRPPRPEEL